MGHAELTIFKPICTDINVHHPEQAIFARLRELRPQVREIVVPDPYPRLAELQEIPPDRLSTAPQYAGEIIRDLTYYLHAPLIIDTPRGASETHERRDERDEFKKALQRSGKHIDRLVYELFQANRLRPQNMAIALGNLQFPGIYVPDSIRAKASEIMCESFGFGVYSALPIEEKIDEVHSCDALVTEFFDHCVRCFMR